MGTNGIILNGETHVLRPDENKKREAIPACNEICTLAQVCDICQPQDFCTMVFGLEAKGKHFERRINA